ncbi:mitochondrial carrier [Phaffia rhodozyma]|uniref:Mitochondrial carrier n=1 Tax=Phaffia rhodozyma TaxID=264483 RepID=A0A0F7SRW3_PHARH|nr:mitochondrial carrier [Phaffia rhodozyma]
MADLKKPVLTYPFWCGGAAASMAACVTHPLDLLRVRMQTSQIKTGFGSTAVSVFKANGVPGFYSGLSASIMRQMTYSVTRFGAYEHFKDVFRQRNPGSKLTPMQMILAASLAGVAGGIAGNPADIILVRMTADASKPPAERLNYKHCFDGVFRVIKEEGVQQLFRGLGPNLVRAVLMNASQLASYDWFKEQLIARLDFKDGLFLHSMASLGAGTVATTICAPADVVRSRVMNSKSTEGPVSVLLKSLKSEGPQFLFKGWTPAWIRLAPNTVLIFIFLEQIRKVVDSTRTLASA